MTLEPFGPSVWTYRQPLKFCGIEVGTCTTLIDIDGRGSLLVHSPGRIDNALRSQIRNHGEIKYVVAPNKMHHLFLEDFRQAYPWAQFFAAPGLDQKRKGFEFTDVIDDEQTFPWNPMLAHHIVKGAPFYNEVVFFHSASKTLILTDLAVHICESSSLWTKIFLKMIGAYGKFGWTPVEKMIFVKDKKAFNQSIERILTWDFDRILLAHGIPILQDGKNKIKSLLVT